MKKILSIFITVLVLLSMTACGGQEPEREQDQDEQREKTSEQTPAPTPTSTPTLSPAEVFGQEKGVMIPNIDKEIVTDIEEIKSILGEYPYWSQIVTDDAKLYGETYIIWYKEDGRYRTYSDFLDIGYGAGVWYFEDDMLITESVFRLDDSLIADLQDTELVDNEELADEFTEFLDDYKTKETLIAAELDDGIHLYSCAEQGFIEYIPATDKEKLIVSTDTDSIANIRYFLCSATWLLVGHYDEEQNYSHRPNNVAYTFLADGQLVVRQDGKNIPGHYTLNVGDGGFFKLNYLLEDGQAHETPLWVDNSSSYASSLFLYPEYMINASDVYMAKHKYNVSNCVVEGEAIPKYEEPAISWSVQIGDRKFQNDEIKVDAPIRIVDSQACLGYMIDTLVEFADMEIGDSVEIVFADGETVDISNPSQALLTFHIEGVNLEAPVLVLVDENKIYSSAVIEIKVN